MELSVALVTISHRQTVSSMMTQIRELIEIWQFSVQLTILVNGPLVYGYIKTNQYKHICKISQNNEIVVGPEKDQG